MWREEALGNTDHGYRSAACDSDGLVFFFVVEMRNAFLQPTLFPDLVTRLRPAGSMLGCL